MSEYKFGTWYPSESAPKDEIVILWIGDIALGQFNTTAFDGPRWEDDAMDANHFLTAPTHWMPAPSGPIEELLLFDDVGTVKTSIKSKDWPGFESFWHWYPNKQGKKPALKSWNKEKPDLNEVRKTLEWQIKSEQWRKGFIPLPTTYLNQRRWEDERPPETKPEQVYQ